MKKLAALTATLLSLAASCTQCLAQAEEDDSATATTTITWSPDQLDQMLGPIALYPDPLVGLILPASTVPSQIVMADRYISQGGDTNLIAQQPWDPAVQGLAHYPDVLKWMDDNIQWTTQLGEAFSVQQSDVMDSIQRLRAKAQSLGNLQSTPQETVEDDEGDIDIEPADPDQVYVPDYQPDLIYDQPGVYCTFGIGFPIGAWLGYDWDWSGHHLVHWGPGHERPAGWWSHPPAWRHDQLIHAHDVWQLAPQPGHVIVRGGDRGYEGRRIFVGAPTRPAPRVRVSETRTVTENRTVDVSRAPVRQAPESAFGGDRSAREVRVDSSRGAASRQTITFGGGGRGGGGRR